MQNVTAGPGTGESMGTTGGSSVATDETDRLIASNKVEGTAVYDRQASASARSTTSWSTSAPARSPTRSCPSAASSAWAGELPPAAVEVAHLRHQPGRLRRRPRQGPAPGGAQLRRGREPGLGPGLRQPHRPALRGAVLLRVTAPHRTAPRRPAPATLVGAGRPPRFDARVPAEDARGRSDRHHGLSGIRSGPHDPDLGHRRPALPDRRRPGMPSACARPLAVRRRQWMLRQAAGVQTVDPHIAPDGV